MKPVTFTNIPPSYDYPLGGYEAYDAASGTHGRGSTREEAVAALKSHLSSTATSTGQSPQINWGTLGHQPSPTTHGIYSTSTGTGTGVPWLGTYQTIPQDLWDQLVRDNDRMKVEEVVRADEIKALRKALEEERASKLPVTSIPIKFLQSGYDRAEASRLAITFYMERDGIDVVGSEGGYSEAETVPWSDLNKLGANPLVAAISNIERRLGAIERLAKMVKKHG